MAENKTMPTNASVRDYIVSRARKGQGTDCRALMALFGRVTGHRPRMWGPSIVGYGSCRYRHESGRSGEMPLAAFAIRGTQLVVYLDAEDDGQRALLSRLGPHKMGKACLYFKRLADLDMPILEQLVVRSVATAKRRGLSASACRSRRGKEMAITLAGRIRNANEALLVRGDVEAVGRFFAPDYVAHLTGRDAPGGHELVRNVVAMYQGAFSDIAAEVEILAEQRDRVAWQRTIRATHRGPFKGFPATKRPLVWREMVTSRFQDDLITEEWFITDLAEQLLLSRKAQKT